MKVICCPDCDGKGKSFCHINTGFDSSKHEWGDVKCHRCKGVGGVPVEMTKWIERGSEIRKQRACAGISLLEKAKSLGISPAQLSSIESGKVENSIYFNGVNPE